MKSDKFNLNSIFKRLGNLSVRKKAKKEPAQFIDINKSVKREAAKQIFVQEDAPNQPQGPFHSLFRKAVADAEDIANAIKARAQAEAEVEAKMIIAQANLETQEIKGKAQIEAQREAEKTLSAANKKAEMIEIEAKQKVLQLLAAASVEIENELRSEYERAYSRLSSSLHSLIEESHNIEENFKSRRAKLLENKKGELKEYEAVLLSMPVATFAETQPRPPEVEPKIESKTEATAKKAEQTVETRQKKSSEEQAEQLAKGKFSAFSNIIRAVKREPLTKEVAKPPKTEAEPLIEKAARVEINEKVEEHANATAEPMTEKPTHIKDITKEPAKEVAKDPIKPVIKEEKVKAEPIAENHPQIRDITKEPEQEIVKETVNAVMKEDNKERFSTQFNLDRQALYTGEVELVIAPPTEIKLVTKLFNYLQTIPELKVLYTRGSWDQGTTVTLAIEKPLPLINILSETPEIKIFPELAEDPATGKSSSLIKSERRTGRIKLNLRER